MANIADLQTLSLGALTPCIPALLHDPQFNSLPTHLRERLFQYIISNKCLYQYPDVPAVIEYFAKGYMEEFDVAKNGLYVTDKVLEKLQHCHSLQKLSLRY